MDLFLVPNNPEHTVLVSPNGVAHYQVATSKHAHSRRRVSQIRRPAESEEDSFIADIEWKSFESPTVLRSPLLVRAPSASFVAGAGGRQGRGVGVLANDFLYKRGHFSSTRYFRGDDLVEYRWKIVKGIGCVLTHGETNEEIARFTHNTTTEGLYAGERKSRLRIQPRCSVDLDLVVLSFLMMEKKRRDRAGDRAFAMMSQDHDEDPQGDGGGDGGGE